MKGGECGHGESSEEKEERNSMFTAIFSTIGKWETKSHYEGIDSVHRWGHTHTDTLKRARVWSIEVSI